MWFLVPGRARACMCVNVCVCMRLCVHVCVHVYLCIDVRARVCVILCVCVCVCVWVRACDSTLKLMRQLLDNEHPINREGHIKATHIHTHQTKSKCLTRSSR